MRYWLLCLICLLGLVCGAATAAESLSPDDDFQMRKFLYEGAEFLANNETARALARFNSAKKLSPENPECYYWIALAYSDLQNYGVAARNAETAVSLSPNLAKAWLLWGQSLFYENKYDLAREKLEKAFRLEPNNYLAAFNLGRCFYYGFNGEKKSQALRFFQHAWELNEDFVAARYYTGCIQLEQEQYPLAIVSLRWVVTRDPRNVDAHYRLGLAYRKDNHIAQAEKEFLEALAIDPNNFESHLQLGHIYLIEKPSREKALEHFNEFLRLAPADHAWRQRIEDLLRRDREKRRREGTAPTATPPAGAAGGQ